MFLLKKIFQFRDHVNPDNEKPFLEHLDDLRSMILKIVITLVVAMLVCFSFQEKLMEVLRRPVERVWMDQLLEKLPQGKDGSARAVDIDTWERAKAVEHAVLGLEPGQREAFFQALDNDNLRFHAQSVELLRTALALPKDKREGFVSALPGPDDLKGQVRALLKTAPSPEIDLRGNLRLMSALKPTETFMLSMKLSFFAGIVLSFPLLMMFVLQFVLPGLHSNEKRLLGPSMAVGFGLFLGGVLFAYYAVLPRVLGFFYDWGGKLGVSNDWRIGEYISFATQFTLLFGLSFELPVVVMVLVKLGLLTYETMSRTRSYAIVAIFVAAAILTPTPDALTMTMMATPMLVLYEICIWLAWWDVRKARKAQQAQVHEPTEPPPSSPATEAAEAVEEVTDTTWRDQYPDLIAPPTTHEAATPESPPESPPFSPKAPRKPRAPRKSKTPGASEASDSSAIPKAPGKPRAPRKPKAPQPPEAPGGTDD
ncbi:MAG: twin-arginine translocase subunit TatC [Verrucomicrobiota bacterium]